MNDILNDVMCEWGQDYYHWCIFVDDKPIIQGKDYFDLEHLLQDYLQTNNKWPIKVIKTKNPLEDTIDKLNNPNDSILYLDKYFIDDENTIFNSDAKFIVDVTNEFKKLLEVK